MSSDNSGRGTTKEASVEELTCEKEDILRRKILKWERNNMSHPESIHSRTLSPSQASPDQLQTAIDQALGDRWNQLVRYVEAQQNELNQRMQSQLDETVAAAASQAEARMRQHLERPTLNIIKPTKPPTYKGARQGAFTQWAFQVRQYLQLMCVQDKSYCVRPAANQF